MKNSADGEKRQSEFDVEALTDEAMKLLNMDISELYATLGGQLLGRGSPTRAAGMMSYLSAIRSESIAKNLYEVFCSAPVSTDWGVNLGVIYEGLKQDGIRYLSDVSEDLRKALCKEDFFRMCDEINRSTMQIVIIVIGAALRIPPEFDPISATMAAILFKIGLRNFSLPSVRS